MHSQDDPGNVAKVRIAEIDIRPDFSILLSPSYFITLALSIIKYYNDLSDSHCRRGGHSWVNSAMLREKQMIISVYSNIFPTVEKDVYIASLKYL